MQKKDLANKFKKASNEFAAGNIEDGDTIYLTVAE